MQNPLKLCELLLVVKNAPWIELCPNSSFRRRNSSALQVCTGYTHIFFSILLFFPLMLFSLILLISEDVSHFRSYVGEFCHSIYTLFWIRNMVCGHWKVGRWPIVYSLFSSYLKHYTCTWVSDLEILENHIIRRTVIFLTKWNLK